MKTRALDIMVSKLCQELYCTEEQLFEILVIREFERKGDFIRWANREIREELGRHVET